MASISVLLNYVLAVLKYVIYHIVGYIVNRMSMPRIITTSELQKHIGKLLEFVGNSWAIVTSRGKAKVVMLPYFDANDKAIEDYLEDYEMHQHADQLKKELQASYDSGPSDLVM